MAIHSVECTLKVFQATAAGTKGNPVPFDSDGAITGTGANGTEAKADALQKIDAIVQTSSANHAVLVEGQSAAAG